MKIKTSNLIGVALDWAVAKCENLDRENIGAPFDRTFESEFVLMHTSGELNYSTDWALAGPIIERERIEMHQISLSAKSGWYWLWAAYRRNEKNALVGGKAGESFLITAMVHYVSTVLGEIIEIPDAMVEIKVEWKSYPASATQVWFVGLYVNGVEHEYIVVKYFASTHKSGAGMRHEQTQFKELPNRKIKKVSLNGKTFDSIESAKSAALQQMVLGEHSFYHDFRRRNKND